MAKNSISSTSKNSNASPNPIKKYWKPVLSMVLLITATIIIAYYIIPMLVVFLLFLLIILLNLHKLKDWSNKMNKKVSITVKE